MRLFFLMILFWGCSSHEKNMANQHMHQKPHKELIACFDDPVRDEWQKPHLVLKHLGSLKGKRIIDIGAGSGYFTKFFLSRKGVVVAADVDQVFLDHLKKTFPISQYPNLSTNKVDYNDPRMEKESFDLAFTSNTYHHIDNRVEYFKKVFAGLRPGGKLAVLDFTPSPISKKELGPPLKMRVDPITVFDELKKAGFSELELIDKEFDHQYLIMAEKKENN
jgi:SAM-dependent methyltransferase